MIDDSGSFQFIPNPYIVGKPIEDRKMFFGREDDFAFIKKKVTGGETGGILVLCGSRRSGKTSILFQIKQRRLGDQFVPVLIDMQSMTVENDKEFLSKLAIEVIAAIGDPALSFEKDFLDHASDNPHSAFQKLAMKVGTVLGNKKLIIMFDEYELFETQVGKGKFSSDILNTLANWMEHKNGVFLIFTGSDKLESRMETFWERFLPKAIHRRISFISKSDTFRLIHEPVEGLIRYDEGVPEEIYRLTAGQPFYSQVICQSIVDHLNEVHRYEVNLDDIRAVVKDIIENPLPQMIFAWSSLSDFEKLSLSIMAELTKEEIKPLAVEEIQDFAESTSIGYQLEMNKLREATEKLFHHDYLEKMTPGRTYLFKMDLWRLWVMRMHSIWQVTNEIGAEDHELEEGIIQLEPPGRVRARRLQMTLGVLAAVVIIPLVAYIFIIKPNRTGPQTIALQQDSTLITVDTEPPGAYVFLGETFIGQTPIEGKGAVVGRATLRVNLEGYHEEVDSLELIKDEPVKRSFVLLVKTGSIRITSAPSGADIVLDGETTGLRTPATIEDLSVNKLHRVGVRLSGFIGRTQQGIEVAEGVTTEIHLELSTQRHPLTIESAPYEANIYIDGEFRGTTPQSFTAIEEGSHSVELRKEGYRYERMSITVPYPNDRLTVRMVELDPGNIVLRIVPWADLYVDGELLEKESLGATISLKAGMHTVELRHKDYGIFRDTLWVRAALDTTIEYNVREKRAE